jgi:hypothetical protein
MRVQFSLTFLSDDNNRVLYTASHGAKMTVEEYIEYLESLYHTAEMAEDDYIQLELDLK